jgi:hypothetical protein
MLTYTAAQWAILLADSHDQKICFKMTRDVEDDLLYCSGADPVTVGADEFVPRELVIDALSLGDPSRMGLTVSIDDADSVVRAAWYAERFSGNAALVILLLKLAESAAWTTVYQVSWKVRYGHYKRDGTFDVELHSAVGLRPRAGLLVGTRGEFPYAPEPGQSIRVGGYSVTFHGGGGGDGGFNPAVIRYPDGGGFDPSPWGK